MDRYSGGMAQRLMIARCLMHKPGLLFMDEPSTGLDPQARLFVWDRIRDLHREGPTVFLTTQDLDEADTLCGRVAIMDKGAIIAMDTPEAPKRLVPGASSLELRVVLPEPTRIEALLAALRALPGVDAADVAPEGPPFDAPPGGGGPPPWVAAMAGGASPSLARSREGRLIRIYAAEGGR